MSVSQKRYKNAPIAEAVIELRVHPQESFKHSALNTLATALKAEFPKQVPMRLVRMGFALPGQPDGGVNLSSSDQPVGVRLTNSDESRVLQVRRDGMAYSHMPPYTEWTIFRSEAQPLWERFRSAFPEAKLARCGLRYINRVDVPGTTVELHDYFRLYPEVPRELPQQDVVGMVMNLQMPQLDLECMAVINQAQTDPAKPGHLSFVFDVDLFRQGVEAWTDSEAWDFFDKLRTRKNEIFEACITDRMRELIDR